MSKNFLSTLAMAALVLGFHSSAANAIPILSPLDAALSGATVIDFESQTIGSYTSLSIGDVTFTGNDGNLRIQSTYAGSFNTTGQYLDNHTSGFRSLSITFNENVDAFGFYWGASNNPWSLNAFDSSNNLLETYSLPILASSNNGEFYGIAQDGIREIALFQADNGSTDWILVDGFHYVEGTGQNGGNQNSGGNNNSGGGGSGSNAVPEPSTMILFGSGLVGAMIRKKFA